MSLVPKFGWEDSEVSAVSVTDRVGCDVKRLTTAKPRGGGRAMSGGSSNSWTIVTPEEMLNTQNAETLRPLAEGTERHEESLAAAAGSGANQPAEGEASAEGSPGVEHLVSAEKAAELSGDSGTERHASVPSAVTDGPVPTSLEVSGSVVPDSDALSQPGDRLKGPERPSPDPDSFSDSYTHVTPCPDEPPASPPSTETLGGVELPEEEEEEERLAQEGMPHPLHGEEPPLEGEESHLSPRTTASGQQADSPADSGEGGERLERTEGEGEPEVRRRRSLLAALERIGRTEEDEEGEDEFQLPRREEESAFSLNKCILAAVILLGLGTIFFSGVFMDLDEESDYTRELRDSEVPGKQEWLNPEVPPPPADADGAELLSELAKENQQIAVLQAQLQAQKEELKVAAGQAAEGAKERLRREEVEEENSRLKTEVASLHVLQRENERMKRELDSVPALQKELEMLTSTVTELKLSSAASEAAQPPAKPAVSPPSGQEEDSRQDTAGTAETQAEKPRHDQKEKKTDRKKEKYDTGEKKEWKEREESEWKEGEQKERKDGGKTERKRGKHEQGKFEGKERDKGSKQERPREESKHLKEREEGKKEKVSRGDEGKPWKTREGKKERVEKSERKDWKEEKDWKKAKHEKVNEGNQWRGKEGKNDWRGGKDQGEKHKAKEEWRGEKEWRKVKDGHKESGKEKWEKKDWKEKGEKKEWKNDGEGRSKNGKDKGKEGKGKGERKEWDGSENHGKNPGKEKKVKDEARRWNENMRKSKNGKDDGGWKRRERDEDEGKSKDAKGWRRKDERRQREKEEEERKGGQGEERHSGDRKRERSGSGKRGEDERRVSADHRDGHVWGDGRAPHTHRRPSLDEPDYWLRRRDRLRRHPKPPQRCDSAESCARAEGLLPVPFPEFHAVLQTYLAKAEEVGVAAPKREELQKLAAEFFRDGVFVHDQMSFQEFAEDVGDILEDMVEGDENGEEEEEEEEDSAIEEEMEAFERDVMEKFSAPGAGEKEERIKGERRKESGRGRG